MNSTTRALYSTSDAVERLHLAGDPVDRPVGCLTLVAECRLDVLGDLRQAVAPQLERDQQRLLGGRHVLRDGEVARLRERLVRRIPEADDLLVEVLRRLRAALLHLPEELVAGVAGLDGEVGDPAVVVAQRVLVAPVVAGADDDEEHDQERRADDDGDHAPDQHALRAARAAAGDPATAWRRGRARAGTRGS